MNGLFLTSCRHWWEPINTTVIKFHPSITSESSRERTRAADLIDRDSNDCYFPARQPWSGCLCEIACKRSPAICCKRYASNPGSKLLFVPIWYIWPAYAVWPHDDLICQHECGECKLQTIRIISNRSTLVDASKIDFSLQLSFSL